MAPLTTRSSTLPTKGSGSIGRTVSSSVRRAGRHTQPSALALGGAGFAGSGFFFCDEGVAEDELAGRFGIFLALRVEEGGRRAAVASEVLLRDERRAAALLVALLERFLRGGAAE